LVRFVGGCQPGPAAVQFADAQLRSSTVALGAAQLYLVESPAGLAASALNCGPLSNCLIAPRVGQACLLHGLQGTATLPSHCSVLKRVCSSIQTYSPLYKHCRVSPEVFFASKYNEMSVGQYASGLSARTGTTKSHIKHWIKNRFTPLTRILISRVNVTEVFLHTIGVSESRDSLEVLFPTVSHDRQILKTILIWKISAPKSPSI